MNKPNSYSILRHKLPVGQFEGDKMDKLTLAICLPGGYFTNGFLMSMVTFLHELSKNGINYLISNYYSADIYTCRNQILLMNGSPGFKAEVFEGKHYDYMLWIDSDIKWSTEDFFKLLSLDVDIASATYTSDGDILNAGYLGNDGQHKIKASNAGMETYTKVDYVGFGFILVKRGVFESIKYPWFCSRVAEYKDVGNQVLVSEDVGWCMRAREKEYDIHLDLSTVVTHQKRMDLPSRLSGFPF